MKNAIRNIHFPFKNLLWRFISRWIHPSEWHFLQHDILLCFINGIQFPAFFLPYTISISSSFQLIIRLSFHQAFSELEGKIGKKIDWPTCVAYQPVALPKCFGLSNCVWGGGKGKLAADGWMDGWTSLALGREW